MKLPHIIGGIALIGIAATTFIVIKSKATIKYKTSINAPLEGNDLAFEQYIIHPDSGAIIERNTGTQLTIPANSFVRKDGSKPTGDVALKVREMHNPYAIMQSGIPMEVAGSDGKHLQSAGMIEIRAYEGDDELQMPEGKKIGIELAAYKSSGDYSLYFLKEDRQWETKDSFSHKSNDRRKNKLNTLSKQPAAPIDSTAINEFVFLITADTNYNPELKPFVNQEWLLLENDKMEAVKKAVRQNWNSVTITTEKKRKMQYRIRFSFDESTAKEYGVDSICSFLAQPIMSNDQSRRKNRKAFAQKIEEYELLVKQNETEKERVKQQAEMVNAFSINQTGVWNIDKIMKEEVIITKVKFDFENEMKGSKNDHKIFMIFEDNNSVIYVPRTAWNEIPFPANQSVSIAAAISVSEVAFIPSEVVKGSVRKGNREINMSSQRMSYKDFVRKAATMGSVVRR